MTHRLFALALLLVPAQAFAQEGPAEIAAQMFDLRIDRLVAEGAALQAKAEALAAERALLDIQIEQWNDAQDSLKAELDQYYDCPYSLSERACRGGVLPSDIGDAPKEETP